MLKGRRALFVVGASLLVILATVSAHADERLAVTRVGTDQISFTSTQNDHGLVLTVAGPGEPSFERSFEPGEVAVFSAVGDDGKALPDGVYTYELRPIVVVKPEIRREMDRARERGDDSLIAELQAEGTLPTFLTIETGSFSIDGGRLANLATPEIVNKDILHYDDVIITGSLCVGFDCQNGESFGFDTIILKEHNLRIFFNDTSYSASYPTNNWRMTVNSSSNGGASFFSIDDVDDGTSIFKIEAGAPSNSLYVEDYGRVGLGTSTPVTELHIKDSDTPTHRLEQDSSGGWSAQTWDVAGNESNFFIRDASNGSKLPFRIAPSTPSSTLTLKADGNVGIGTWSPEATLHAVRSGGTASAKTMLHLENNGGVRFDFEDTNAGSFWRFQTANSNNELQITRSGTGATELQLDNNGNLTVDGDINSGGTTVVPDYVFSPGYSLMSIKELETFITKERHLPGIPSAKEIEEHGSVNLSKMQMRLLEKIEELTLYVVEQQKTIDELEARLAAVEK